MRNCFDGYLTPACATCLDWCDGSDPERGLGCGCHFPIAWCDAFSQMTRLDSLSVGTRIRNVDNPDMGSGVLVKKDNTALKLNALVRYDNGTLKWENVHNIEEKQNA